jgi:3-oxoacyl-(acyl-carrier-protein) synthase
LNAAAGQVAIWHKLRGINTTIASGATSGAHAIGYALQMIRAGRADALVAGGAEELCYESFHGARQAMRLATPNGGGVAVRPFDQARSGTAMGEGAAFVALEAEDAARERGARVLARVSGFGTAYDPDTHSASTASGDAMAQAIGRALKDAGIAAHDIGAVVSSASGSRDLDAREGAGIGSALGPGTPVAALKSMTGEALGASGALQAVAALESMRTGRLPGVFGLAQLDAAIPINAAPSTRTVAARHALITSIAPEGNCCAVVLSLT